MVNEVLAILLHIVYTIVTNTISTLQVIWSDVALILMIGFSTPENSIFSVLTISFIVAIVLIGFTKFGISSLKVIIIGSAILVLLLILAYIL